MMLPFVALAMSLSTSPSPSPAPLVCTRAVTVASRVTPDYPDSHLNDGVYRKPQPAVLVTISATGKLIAAQISRSSGVPEVDQAMLRAARESTYLPRISHCKAVKSTYLFTDEDSVTPI